MSQEVQLRLRQLPPVGGLLESPEFSDLLRKHSRGLVRQAIAQTLESFRNQILSGLKPAAAARDVACESKRVLDSWQHPSLRRVVNATGILLNTNLGRSPIAQEALEQAYFVAQGYSNLEFDLVAGSRGERHDHIEALLARLTGAQAALAVNNNAAAVLLVVDTLARGREVVVSRGELLEIGGSFRIPDVITVSGATLREVGTTNKTRRADYLRAIAPNTGMLLKCHSSNFSMVGFTESVGGAELAEIAHSAALPAVEDLGSGTLIPLERYGLPHEPTIPESVAAGLDLVTFSGDKLLGGPQAGIIVGNSRYVEQLKRNPLLRALRLDKTTIALLEATLRIYLDADHAARRIPILAMLSSHMVDLRARAEALAHELRTLGWQAYAVQSTSQTGGGSFPGVDLPTWVVGIASWGAWKCHNLADRLRVGEPPVVGRVAENKLLLDVRTLLEGDELRIVEAFGRIDSRSES